MTFGIHIVKKTTTIPFRIYSTFFEFFPRFRVSETKICTIIGNFWEKSFFFVWISTIKTRRSQKHERQLVSVLLALLLRTCRVIVGSDFSIQLNANSTPSLSYTRESTVAWDSGLANCHNHSIPYMCVILCDQGEIRLSEMRTRITRWNIIISTGSLLVVLP